MDIFKLLFSPASFIGWPGGFHAEGPFVFAVPVFAIYLIFFVGSLVWVYRDASSRGRNGLMALFLIFLTGWPLSFVWWFWLRPPLREKSREPRPVVVPLPAVTHFRGSS